jgi:hypothetical protein
VDLAVAVEVVEEASEVEEVAAVRAAIKETLAEDAVDPVVVAAEKAEVSAVVAEAVVEIDNFR